MGSRMGRLRVLGAAVGLGVVLTACSTDGSEDPEAPEEPSASASADPSATPDADEEDPALLGAPEVGECRDITVEQVEGRSVDAFVPCDGRHTSVVVEVVALPDGLTPSSPVDDILEVTDEFCLDPAAELLGGEVDERRVSRFGRAFFRPTRAQEADGASWVACDVYALLDGQTAPMPPRDAAPYLDDAETREAWTTCFRLGDDNQGESVGCDRPHRVETGQILEFPTTAAAEREDLSQRCRDSAAVEGGVNLSVGFLDPAEPLFDDAEVAFVTCLVFDSESVA